MERQRKMKTKLMRRGKGGYTNVNYIIFCTFQAFTGYELRSSIEYVSSYVSRPIHRVLSMYHRFVPTCSPGVSKPLCLHCVSLLDYYPSGVGAMEYHSEILIVAGWCEQQDGGKSYETAVEVLLTVCVDAPLVSGWKLQSDSPYWTPLPGQRISPVSDWLVSSGDLCHF